MFDIVVDEETMDTIETAKFRKGEIGPQRLFL